MIVVLVVQDPDLVVERVTVVAIVPVGLLLAETVTVLDEQRLERRRVGPQVVLVWIPSSSWS